LYFLFVIIVLEPVCCHVTGLNIMCVCGNPVFGAPISTDNLLVGPFHRCYSPTVIL